MENKIIECRIIYPLKSFLTQVVFMAVGTFSTISLTKVLNSPIVFCFGFLIFFIIPAFYNKPVKDYFTKRAVFRFDENGFTIVESDLKSVTLEKTVNYLYHEINGCSLSSKQGKYSALILLLNNGTTKKFTFVDNDDVDSGEIIYNQIISDSEKIPTIQKIKLIPHFYVSKWGTRIIIAIAIAMVIFIAFQLFYIKKGLPISIISTLTLFILILLRRKSNLTKH